MEKKRKKFIRKQTLFRLCIYGAFFLVYMFAVKHIAEKTFVFAEEKLGKWEKSLETSDEAFQSAAEDLNRIMLEHENQKKQQAEYAKKSPEIRKSAITLPVLGDNYATIEIERLNMSVPLYYGDTNALLKKGAGQYIGEGSAIFGEGRQILVAGHNTKEFKPLQNAQIGDVVKVTTTYGEFVYEIVKIQVYDRNDSLSYDFNLDHEQLAMYTCYPFSGPPGKTDRYFCYCDKLYGPVLVDD